MMRLPDFLLVWVVSEDIFVHRVRFTCGSSDFPTLPSADADQQSVVKVDAIVRYTIAGVGHARRFSRDFLE